MTRPSTKRTTSQPTAAPSAASSGSDASPSSQPSSPKASRWRRWLRRFLWLMVALCGPLLAGLAWLMFAAPSGSRARDGLQHPYFRCPCPLILAHQGASGHAPSNTLVSFRKAKAMGADILELDVHRTADGVVVVSHDPTLRRHTNSAAAIKELSWQQLQAVDAGYRFSRDGERFPYRGKGIKVPSLAQVLKAFPRSRINIEIKQREPPMAKALWDVIHHHNAQRRVMVASFWTGPLQAFRRHAKGAVPTSASIRQVLRFLAWWRLGLSAAWGSNVDALQLPHALSKDGASRDFLITPSLLRAAHHKQRHVQVWTVNEQARMERLLRRGVDGIITDFPDRARAAMIAVGARTAASFRSRQRPR